MLAALVVHQPADVFASVSISVSTYAGSDNYLDGNGTATRFNQPKGIAADGAGNVYVADATNNRIRKIDASGNVTTIAGSKSGYLDGTGTAAQFNNPSGIAVDVFGNLYVADTGNNRIRKISSTGSVTTIAGGYLTGSSDGNATNATFNNPSGIAVDGAGNLYVADTLNSRIRKIDSSGNVTTIAGGTPGFTDGNGTSSQFNTPYGITIDQTGYIYVADTYNNAIREIDPLGNVNTVSSVHSPYGVKIDSLGDLYVADTGYHQIIKIDGNGTTTIVAGSTSGYVDGNASGAKFSLPKDLAIDGAGNVFVADTANDRIRKILPSGNVITFAGSGNPAYINGDRAISKFSNPNSVAMDPSGNLYVADTTNNLIRKIDTSGNVTTFAGSTGGYADGNGTAAKFNQPKGIAVDSAGNVYVADTTNHKIRKIDPSGNVTTIAGGAGGFLDANGTSARFSSPNDIAVDSSGIIYVADTNTHRIRKIDLSGNVTTFAGSTTGNVDGTGTAAKFSGPTGLVVDSFGNVYVSDTGNNRIRKITPDGAVTTFAGSGLGTTDGNGTLAKFTTPKGITLDAAGNLYVADYGSNRIRKIDSSANVTTIAGFTSGYTDGTGVAIQFAGPTDIAVNSAGNLFISDYMNNRIRLLSYPAPNTPSTPDLNVSSDTGSSNTDNITNNATPTFSGTAEAGATVELYSGTTLLGSTSTDISGNWSITSSTLSGTVSITAKALVTGGYQSTTSASLSVTIDTTAPNTPSTPDLDSSSDSGSSNTDNFTNDATPTLSGTAESGSTVTLYDTDGTTVLGTGIATGGNYAITVSTLSDGSHTITAKATDVAGNDSVVSSGISLTIDATAPNAPSSPDLTASSDSGSSNTDNITAMTTPTFTGTAESGSTVKLYDTDGTTVIGTAVATGGSYSITVSALSEGNHTITAKAIDSVENGSVASSSLSITIDTTTPNAPSTPDLTAGSDSGSSSSDNITSAVTPTLTGTAETGSRIKLYDTDGITLLGSGWATGGIYSITVSTLPEGTHTITAKATDAAGHTSTASSGLTITIDTSAPNAPSTPNLDALSDLGASNTDGITSTSTPTISGTAEFGSTVTLYDTDGTTVLGTGVTTTAGSFSIIVSALSEGSHTITVKAKDEAGNQSPTSSGLAITIDLTALTPATVTLAGTNLNATSATSITGIVVITAENNADVQVTFTNGTHTVTKSLVGTGSAQAVVVTTNDLTTLTDGTITISTIITDVAGNSVTVQHSFALDTISPVITGVQNGATIKTSIAPTFNEGTATLSMNYGTPNSYLSGTAISSEGHYVLTVTDSVGNVTIVSFTIQFPPPPAPSKQSKFAISAVSIKSSNELNQSMTFTTQAATLRVPAYAFSLNGLQTQLGGRSLSEIHIEPIVRPTVDSLKKKLTQVANQVHMTVLTVPLYVGFEATNGDKTITVTPANKIMTLVFDIPADFNITRLSTAVFVQEDGHIFHLPTQLITVNGEKKIQVKTQFVGNIAFVSKETTFMDTKNNWANAAITDLANRGIIRGEDESHFEPARTMTRAEFASVLVRALGLDTKPGLISKSFGDVAKNSWYKSQIQNAVLKGLMQGDASGKFRPTEKITREQTIVMLVRAISFTGTNTGMTNSATASELAKFKDRSKISTWSKPAIAYANENGLITGSSIQTVNPKQPITRAEVAVLIERLLKYSDFIN